MIDRRRIGVFRIGGVADFDHARRAELAIPIVPSGASAVAHRVMMDGLSSPGREHRESGPLWIAAEHVAVLKVQQMGPGDRSRLELRRMEIDEQRKLDVCAGRFRFIKAGVTVGVVPVLPWPEQLADSAVRLDRSDQPGRRISKRTADMDVFGGRA